MDAGFASNDEHLDGFPTDVLRVRMGLCRRQRIALISTRG